MKTRVQMGLFAVARQKPAYPDVIVDSFAGGGGASLGIHRATGRSPDIAINHDAEAIALHAANHPDSDHHCENVWTVDPREATGGKPVALMWASPDCRHFSKAKNGKPTSNRVRGLAWVVVRWAKLVRPRLIILENVEEFATWGPLLVDGTPDPDKRGVTFRRWTGHLKRLGYDVEHRELRACDFGAPTTRKRLFVIARCDGQPIVWPTPTHGPGQSQPWRTAAEVIDWGIPVPSIFGRTKPLADNTLARIARGVQKFIVESPAPFIVPDAGAAATLVQTGYGERDGQAPRALNIRAPLGTVVAGGAKHALVTAFLARHYTGVIGQPLATPLSTVTTIDHSSLVRALLIKYYGTGEGQRLDRPLDTVTTHDRFGLATVEGTQYEIRDIGLRMLTPRELARAQGFPDDYRLEVSFDGAPLSRTAQTRMVGNSVCPPVAEALVRANYAVSTDLRAACE